MHPELRKGIKALAGVIALLIGVGFLLESAFLPDNGLYLIAFIVTGITWLNMWHNDRNSTRDEAVRKAFGVPESELRGLLSHDRITEMLNNPAEIQDYFVQLKDGMAPHYRRALEDPSVSAELKATYRKALGDSSP